MTFSCAEPRRILGPFWSKALDSPEQEIEESFLQMLRDAHVDVDSVFGHLVARGDRYARSGDSYRRSVRSLAS